MLRDSTTGLGKTGLLTGDMTGSYVREGGTKVALSFTSASAGDSFSTGRWAEVDATNMRGLYQFHLPNASLATGAEAVTFHFNATGVIDKIIRISLLDVDLRNATNAGLSNLNATISSRSDLVATDIVLNGAIGTFGGAVNNVTTVTNVTNVTNPVTVGTNNDKTGYSIAGTKTNLDSLNDISLAGVNGEVDTALTDIGLDHLLSASASGSDVTDNSIVAKIVSKSGTADWDSFDNTTDSLEAIRDRGDAAWTTGGGGGGYTPAEIADAVLDEALSGHTTSGSLGKAISDIESDVDSIKNDTGSSIPTTLTTLTGKVDVIDSTADSILEDTGTTLPATLSTLSTLDAAGVRSAVGLGNADLDSQLGTIDTNVDAILIDTSTTIPNTLSGLSTLDAAGIRSAVGLASANLDSQLTTIDSNVDSILSDTGTTLPASIAAIGTSETIADAVWDESLASHNAAGSTGKALKQVKEGIITVESQVNDAAATTTTFITDLVETADGFYHDKVIVFISGNLSGQARHIETYTGSTKSITVSQAFTEAPADDDEFLILATHEHSLDEIADSVWDEPRSGHLTIGTFGYYLDARVSQAGGGGGASASDIWGALLVDYATPGTFGARFQEADRYTNTSANIRYVNQGDSYDGTSNPVLTWTVSKDYTAFTVTLEVIHRVTGATLLSKTISAIDETTIQAPLTATDTAFSDLTTPADFGAHRYIIKATLGSSVDSAVIGAMIITET